MGSEIVIKSKAFWKHDTRAGGGGVIYYGIQGFAALIGRLFTRNRYSWVPIQKEKKKKKKNLNIGPFSCLLQSYTRKRGEIIRKIPKMGTFFCQNYPKKCVGVFAAPAADPCSNQMSVPPDMTKSTILPFIGNSIRIYNNSEVRTT